MKRELIRDRVLTSFLMHVHETTMPLIDRELDIARTACLSGYAAEVDFPHMYYEFADSRNRDGPCYWQIPPD